MRDTPPPSWYDPPEPPAEVECRECGEDVIPGSECECGTVAPSEAELREEAEFEAADRMYDARAERAEMEDLDHDY